MTELPEGWLLDEEAELLTRLASNRVVLELGAWKGRSTVALARHAKLVVSVDWHRGDDGTGPGDTLTEYLASVRELTNVVPVVARFDEFLSYLGSQNFDTVFVDGAHDWQSARSDLHAAHRLCRPGGVIACHDYTTHEEVRRAWGDVFFRNPDQIVGSIAVRHL
jgi:predicted O-methyltransferase YrrM